jgi:hypothetical protein
VTPSIEGDGARFATISDENSPNAGAYGIRSLRTWQP